VKSVSVLVPVLQSHGHPRPGIDSALIQEFDDGVEIIATNDGSTDRTQEVLDSFGPRIKVVRQANRGNTAARNATVAQAQGQYLAFLDADDIWLPRRLCKTVAALKANPKAVLAFSDVIPMSEDGELGQSWVARGAPSMEQVLGTWWGLLRLVPQRWEKSGSEFSPFLIPFCFSSEVTRRGYCALSAVE
jgi:cellulose synthase/poly-beta-1,6-N-acetylglucosamine synthase-like glycosyltransferase